MAKHKTSILLIDFNRGEIVDSKTEGARSERMVFVFRTILLLFLLIYITFQGTLMFMARAIRANGPLGEINDHLTYITPPELSSKIHSKYKQVHPDRLDKFPHNPQPSYLEIDATMINDNKRTFRHELHHDAESAFWLLVWWSVHACPESAAPSQIQQAVWASFVETGDDSRMCTLPKKALDPAYSALNKLLRCLGWAVQPELHWANEEPLNHPQYLHEVLQRYILNFIIDNQDKEFMSLRKANRLRQTEKVTQITPYTLSQVESLRQHSEHSQPQAVSDYIHVYYH